MLTALLAAALAADVATPAPTSLVASLFSNSIVQDALGVLLVSLLTGVLSLATWALKSLQKKLEEEAKTSKLARAGAVVVGGVRAVVSDIEVNDKPRIARILEDGKVTPEEAKELRELAADRITKKVPAAALQVVQEHYGDFFPHWLAGTIEEAHATMKTEAHDSESPAAIAVAVAGGESGSITPKVAVALAPPSPSP